MSNQFDNKGFRRFDGDTEPRKKRSPVMIFVVLIIWLSIIFSVLFQEFSGTPDWMRVWIVGGIGIIGAAAMIRGIVRSIKAR